MICPTVSLAHKQIGVSTIQPKVNSWPNTNMNICKKANKYTNVSYVVIQTALRFRPCG